MGERDEMGREEKVIRGTKTPTQKLETERRRGLQQRMGQLRKEVGIPEVKHKWDVILFLSTPIQEQNPAFLGTTFWRLLLVRTSPPG